MGNTPAPSIHAAFVGLSGAGKSTMCRVLESPNSPLRAEGYMCHIGPQHWRVKYKDAVFELTDVAGHRERRPLWREDINHEKCQAIVFVVDSAYREELSQAQAELVMTMMQPEFFGLPLVIAFNKQDLPQACSVSHLTETLFDVQLLDSLSGNWYTQACAAPYQEGVSEILEFILHTVQTPRVRRPFSDQKWVRTPPPWTTELHHRYPIELKHRLSAVIIALHAGAHLNVPILLEYAGSALIEQALCNCVRVDTGNLQLVLLK